MIYSGGFFFVSKRGVLGESALTIVPFIRLLNEEIEEIVRAVNENNNKKQGAISYSSFSFVSLKAVSREGTPTFPHF